tara:strand:+ start:627 stop:1040 length:414 start_codon:yes stop_codon:yes gene_type:complete
MNKEQLKKTLRPLIKECIKEVIFEEGVLSGIISEVVRGTSQPLVESRQPSYQQTQIDYEARERAEKQRRKKILDSIGRDAYNGVDLFEGTQPLQERRSTHSSPHGSRPLDGIAPNDPGVNLASLGIDTRIWSKLAKG